MSSQDMTARTWRSTVSQVLASSAKNIIIFASGLSLGYPTIVIPKVHNAPGNATLSLTDEEVSWFGSVNFVAIPLGSILSGTISQRFGRKRSMQCMTIPLAVTWIMYYYADSAAVLCAATALSGFVGGLLEAPVLTYISEISEPRLRGILSASAPLASLFGSFLLFFLGSLIDWRALGAACTAGPILGFIALFFVPESPYWLISKNRFEETQKALCWLRGWTTEECIQEEFDKLKKEIHPEMRTTGQDNETVNEQKSRFCTVNIDNYLKRTFTLPFLLIMFIFAAVQFSGITPLTTFSVNIFNSFGAPLNGYYATAILGLARLLGALVCVVLIHYTGKRPIAFTSIAGASILFCGVGLYGYLYLGVEKLDNGSHIAEQFDGAPNHSWFPMVSFIGASFFGYLGLRVLPWIVVGEIFPTSVRGAGSGISAGLGYLMGFVANKTFFDLISAFTLSGAFMSFAVVGFVSLIVLYFSLPETEGRSLAEVEKHFAGRGNLIKAGVKKTRNGDDLQRPDNPVFVEDESTKL